MLGLIGGIKVSNNEEYKKVIKARMNILLLLFVVGGTTLAVAILAKTVWKVDTVEDKMLGVYTGVGTGFIFMSIYLWIKNKLLLNNDVKLKESRLMSTDERIQEISNRAFRIAAYILIITLYAVGLIGGLFYPILTEVLLLVVGVFLGTYFIAYKTFENRM